MPLSIAIGHGNEHDSRNGRKPRPYNIGLSRLRASSRRSFSVEAIINYERDRAGGDHESLYKIKDVSTGFKGYDVESFGRVIEVKSFRTTGPVEMTSHEWQTASRMRGIY